MNFSPRIVSKHRPDYHSVDSILDFPAFKGKTGEALCMAMYDFITDVQDGTYHFWPSNEKMGIPYRGGDVSDPIKLLAVYGWHICGQAADIWYHLCNAAGMPVRKGALPGHVICEVFYDDKWHFFDIDMWVWFRHPDGHIAGISDLANCGTELTLENANKSNPCSLPDRPLDTYVKMFDDVKQDKNGEFDNIHPNWIDKSHHLDSWLRPGESLTVSESANGYVHVPQTWIKHWEDHPREWHGYPIERFEPFRSYGNGEWHYELPLGKEGNLVSAALWYQEDIDVEKNALTGTGFTEIRMLSPYLFTGKSTVGDDNSIAYHEGAQLTLSGEGEFVIEVYSPTSERIEYARLTNPDNETVDLTLAFQGRYEGIIRVRQDGTLTRWVFHSPILCAPKALPKLVQGENSLSLVTGDKQKSQTLPWKTRLHIPGTNNQEADGPYQYTLSVTSPIKRPFAWFHGLFVFKEASPDVTDAKACIQWRVPGGDWQLLLQEDSLSHSRVQWDVGYGLDGLLTEPATTVEFNVMSDTKLLHSEFTGHLDYSDMPKLPITIEHSWQEEDEQKSFTAKNENAYSFFCEKVPTHHSIKLSNPI